VSLAELVANLRQNPSLLQKCDIQSAANRLSAIAPNSEATIAIGDDCAAIPDGEGYLLLAAEGMLPQFVEAEPWFAGWSAVMVNVSDIYAMGGYPIALVDTLWGQSLEACDRLWEGMQAAARAY